ncbi:MAG: hypothetical protein QMD02_03585 [Bacteroidales bacterium]|nr:hypothetical protein [Bacteroidales bacterium]
MTIVFPAFATEQLTTAGLSFGLLLMLCIISLIVGAIISYVFSKLEDIYPREDIF